MVHNLSTTIVRNQVIWHTNVETGVALLANLAEEKFIGMMTGG